MQQRLSHKAKNVSYLAHYSRSLPTPSGLKKKFVRKLRGRERGKSFYKCGKSPTGLGLTQSIDSINQELCKFFLLQDNVHIFYLCRSNEHLSACGLAFICVQKRIQRLIGTRKRGGEGREEREKTYLLDTCILDFVFLPKSKKGFADFGKDQITFSPIFSLPLFLVIFFLLPIPNPPDKKNRKIFLKIA